MGTKPKPFEVAALFAIYFVASNPIGVHLQPRNMTEREISLCLRGKGKDTMVRLAYSCFDGLYYIRKLAELFVA